MTGIFTEGAIFQKSPQELTALLYEACINNLEEALTAIRKKDFVIVNEKLQKVNDILQRLGAGINYEKGGIIADQLDALYNYLSNKIILANLQKDEKAVKEVLDTITPIAQAWNEATKKKQTRIPAHMNKRNSAYEQNILTESNRY